MSYITAAGVDCTWARVVIGYQGPWHAEVKLSSAQSLPAEPFGVALVIGELTLTGTLVAESDGTQALTRSARIVGGAGGWTNLLPARGYHNDAGVKARLVAEDLARETQERLGGFVPRAERLGVDYARRVGAASRALTEAIGGDGVAWWVDFAGVTQVGQRPPATPAASDYQVLAYDPSERMATVDTRQPAIVAIGATISEGLDAPGVVRELEWEASGESQFRVTAWLGGTGTQPGRLAGLLTTIAQRALDGRDTALYRYRVVSQATDGRVNLQAVRSQAGYPDLAPISVWPGIPGVWAKILPGTECIVAFIEGARAQPIVVGWMPNSKPIELSLGDSPDKPYAARKGDAVEVTMPTGTFTGTIGGAEASGEITWADPTADGTITGGSTKVRIG